MSNGSEAAEVLERIGAERALGMYTKLVEIRRFEERIHFLFLEGNVPGTVHQYIGQEACAVGVCAALSEGDVIASTHRPHGHAIARGLPMRSIAAELYGRATGTARGKGGSMHLGDLSKGMLPAIATVGDNIPIVAGVALAFRLRHEPRVAVSFFGDGAANEGAFHEGLNCAAVYNLPAVFVCENNLYGASTSIQKVVKVENIADRAASYGMRSDIGDGMDVFDVYERASNAIGAARGNGGPTLLELKTFRYSGHSRRDPNNYMAKEEKSYWKARDPIALCEAALSKCGFLKPKLAAEIQASVAKEVDEAIEFALQSPFPEEQELYDGLYTSIEVPR